LLIDKLENRGVHRQLLGTTLTEEKSVASPQNLVRAKISQLRRFR
jgi:hypothetical protein